MSILANNAKLIKVGQEYSAGSGISIDDYVISVTGEFGQTYSAGDNIGIYEQDNQLYISGKDWSSEIADASANAYEQAIAQIPEPQDLSYISAKVDTNTSGIDYISSVCLTSHQDWTDTIKGASSYSYEQSTSYFDNWVEGQYTGDITNITNKITALSGDLDDFYKKTETSSKDEISNALQYVSANAGKTYEGVSPIVVNNTEDKISADTWTFSAGSNVSFVDDNVNKITRIDVELPTPQDLSYISAQTDKANQGVDYLSGVVITALPSDMATTGDVAELAQTISETYQTKGDYLVRSDSANFYPTNNPSGFITGVDLSNYYTKDETSGKEELANAFANIPAGDTEVNAYVHSHSASIDNTSDLVQSNSSTWNDVTAYQSNSASYATTVNIGSNQYGQITGYNSSAIFATASKQAQCDVFNRPITSTYYTTAEANTLSSMLSGAIDYVSANAGGVISSYTTATIEGNPLIISLNDTPINAYRAVSAQEAGVANKARYDYEGNNLVDEHNRLTALKDVVQTNSAQWAEGGNIPVSNYGDLYKVEFDGVDLYGYKSTTTITSEPVYSAVSSQESNYIEHTPYPQWNNTGIQGLWYWSAFDVISISSNGGQIYPPQYGDYRLTALDVYYNAQYVYDYNDQQLADFSGYVGKITLDNLVISSYFDKPSYFDNIKRVSEFRLWFSGNQYEGQLNNSHYICSVGNKVQPEPKTVEGIFVIPQSALPTYEYDNTNKISAINGSAIAAGDEFPISADEAITTYQNNSATYLTAHQAISAEEWNNCYDNVNTNSGAWGGSALPISAGPGIKVNLVDNILVFSNDETVLQDNIEVSAITFTLTEPAGNFDRLRLYDSYGTIVEVSGNNNRISWTFDRTNEQGVRMNRCYTITSNNGINWNEVNVYGWNQTEYTGSLLLNGGTDWWLETNKIIGINRKQ